MSEPVGLELPAEADAELRGLFRAFVVDGRLTRIPARRGRRRRLLEVVIQLFEPGRTYAEAEVNDILTALVEDHVSLRRHLVDEQLLERDHGVYWRIGGRIDVEPVEPIDPVGPVGPVAVRGEGKGEVACG